MQWSPNAESVYKIYEHVCKLPGPTSHNPPLFCVLRPLPSTGWVRGRGDNGGMGIRACNGILSEPRGWTLMLKKILDFYLIVCYSMIYFAWFMPRRGLTAYGLQFPFAMGVTCQVVRRSYYPSQVCSFNAATLSGERAYRLVGPSLK